MRMHVENLAQQACWQTGKTEGREVCMRRTDTGLYL